MARPRANSRPKANADGVQWREPGPAERLNKGKWERILEPLLSRPGQWAMIATRETPAKATSQASNLQGRTVIIPRPDDDWTFVSRGVEVFAIYRKKAKSEASVRRAKPKR